LNNLELDLLVLVDVCLELKKFSRSILGVSLMDVTSYDQPEVHTKISLMILASL